MGVLEYSDDNITSSDERLIDDEWLVTTLSANIKDYNLEDISHLYRTGVVYETMDTSVGGHLCLNPPYGFTPGADSYDPGKIKGRVIDTPEGTDFNIGMGRKYFDYIQSNSANRTLSLSFGIPEFKNIIGFLMGGVDYAKMVIVNEGRSPSYYYGGKFIGVASAFIANPIFTASYYILTTTWKIVFGLSDPRYYHMKPSMHTYFMSLNNLMQLASAERGFTRLDISGATTALSSNKMKIDEYEKGLMAKQMPSIFNEQGVIDVLSIVSRYQRILNTKLQKEVTMMQNASIDSIDNGQDDVKGYTISDLHDSLRGLASFIKKKEKESKETNSTVEDDYKVNRDGTVKNNDTSTWAGEIAKYYSSAITNTSDSIFLQVEYLGEVSDSFSNSTKDLPIKSFMDTTSSAFRDVRFSLGGVSDIIGQAGADILKGARDVVWGVLDGASFGLTNILHGLMGGGYVELPLMWDNSSASVAEHTFKITINNPYANTASLLMDLDLVLYSLMAGMLPRSIGRAAYGSPLLCKAFIPGVCNIDYGMIDQLTITRGTGNIGYNSLGAPMNIEITFKIKDFNEVFTAPVEDGFLGAFNMSADDFSGINKYIKMMSGTSFSDSKFIDKRAMIRLNALYGGTTSFLNPSTLAFLAGSVGMNKTFYNVNQIAQRGQSGIFMFNES